MIRKTISTRHDENGRLVADVFETTSDLGGPRAPEFSKLARCLISSRGDLLAAHQAAVSSRASPRVVELLKAATASGTTTDAAWAEPLSQYQMLSDSWLSGLASVCVWDRLMQPDGFTRAPLRTKMLVNTVGFVGDSDVGEGGTKEVSASSFTAPSITPKKCVCLTVISDEVAKFATVEAVQIFNTLLSEAVARASDSLFITSLYGGTTPTGTAGASTANIITDLGVLMAAVTLRATSRPFPLLPPALAQKLVLHRADGGGGAFPLASINGGEIVPGIPILTNDQVPSGVAMLIDASSILAGSEGVFLDASTEATLQMDSNADSPQTASTPMISLWQQDLFALKAERFMGWSIARSNSVAAISGASW